LGDFAILHAMLADLDEWFPGHPVHIYPHSSLAIDHKRLAAFRSLGAPAFDVAGSTYVWKIPKLLKILRKTPLWPIVQNNFIKNAVFKTGADVKIFSKYKAVFVAGGEQWGKNIGASMIANVQAISKYNDRIYAYPFSINSNAVDIHSKPQLRDNFKLFQGPILVRDSRSFEIIDSLGLEAKLCPDCVFSLFRFAQTISKQSERDTSRILVALTGGSANLRADLRPLVRDLCAEFAHVALFSTCDAVDGKAMRSVSEELGVPYHAPLTWKEAVAELKASALVITNRLHCLIFSLFAGVAVLPVTNRQKVAAIVRDAGILHGVSRLEGNIAKHAHLAMSAKSDHAKSYLEKSASVRSMQLLGLAK
jgi:polysaccharide pyruvyl transferase WcaK-like protein